MSLKNVGVFFLPSFRSLEKFVIWNDQGMLECSFIFHVYTLFRAVKLLQVSSERKQFQNVP